MYIFQMNGECWVFGFFFDFGCVVIVGNDGEFKIWFLDVDCFGFIVGQVEVFVKIQFL